MRQWGEVANHPETRLLQSTKCRGLLSAGCLAMVTCKRVRQSGRTIVVSGQTTNVSRWRLRESSLTMTHGRVLPISDPSIGSKRTQ